MRHSFVTFIVGLSLVVAASGQEKRYVIIDQDTAGPAAWLDPTLITKERVVYMDVNLDRGSGYGDTLIWSDRVKPALDVQLVHAQTDVDPKKFERFFVSLMTAPTPKAKK